MGRNRRNILSGKYRQKLLDHAEQSGTEAHKRVTKKNRSNILFN